jgi:hypothetical protein
MSVVLVTTVSPHYWDDGIQDIYGPFETKELAWEWWNRRPWSQRPELIELTAPEPDPRRDVLSI